MTYFFDDVNKQAVYRTSPLTQWKFAIVFNAEAQEANREGQRRPPRKSRMSPFCCRLFRARISGTPVAAHGGLRRKMEA